MFEWFFGNPKKRVRNTYQWLGAQLSKRPRSKRALKGFFRGIRRIVRRLNRDSLRLYLKTENIIERCKRLDIEIRKSKPEEIERLLESYKDKLRTHLRNISLATGTAEGKYKSPEEILDDFKDIIEKDMKDVKNIMGGADKSP